MDGISQANLLWCLGQLPVEVEVTKDQGTANVRIGQPCNNVTLMLTLEQLEHLEAKLRVAALEIRGRMEKVEA